jgi:hypothetical protein
MSTPFLERFAHALVERLLAEGLLEIREGAEHLVGVALAAHLGGVGEGGQLLTEVDRGLIACADVEELYADLEQLKELVQDLRS